MNDKRQAPDPTDALVAGVVQATAALLKAVNASDVPGVLAVWSDEGVLMVLQATLPAASIEVLVHGFQD